MCLTFIPRYISQTYKAAACQCHSLYMCNYVVCLTSVVLSLCVQKEEEPDVVLVKVEEVELVTGVQSQPGLSIQEGERVDLSF